MINHEDSRERELIGTGEQLDSYVDVVLDLFGDQELTTTTKLRTTMLRELAGRIGDRVNPQGFVLSTRILLGDCQDGENTYPERPLPGSLLDQEVETYVSLEGYARQVAGYTFGEDFGAEVMRLGADLDQSSTQ